MVPFISVIVPVYNTELYLERCIQSILNQTLKELEIIIIDDGSTDKSSNICDNFQKRDKRVVVIHQKNKGVSQTRNKGICCASGRTIMFVDSDDYIEASMCEILWKSFNKNKADLSICGMKHIYFKDCKIVRKVNTNISNGIYNSIQEFEHTLAYLYNNYLIFTPCVKLYNRDILIKNRLFFDEGVSLGEDLIFNLHYIDKCKKFVTVNKCFYIYNHINRGALTQSFSKERIRWGELIFSEANSFCMKHRLQSSLYKEIIIKYYRYYLCAAELLTSSNCGLSKKERKNYLRQIIVNVNHKNQWNVFRYYNLEISLCQIIFLIRSTRVLSLFSWFRNKIKIWLK